MARAMKPIQMLWWLIGAGLIVGGLLGCRSSDVSPRLDDPTTWRLVFESYRDGNAEVYMTDLEGRTVVNLTNHPAYDGTPSVSPDFSRIAFTSERDGSADIYVMRIDGSAVERLTNSPGDAFSVVPEWAPDGVRLAFSSNRTYRKPMDGGFLEVPGNTKIWMLDTKTNTVERLTDGLGLDMYVTWSPDGSQMAFMSVRDGDADIYIRDADGTVRNVTKNDARDTNPDWSPDGRRLLFSSDMDGDDTELYILDLDDNTLTQLTNNTFGDSDPAWSPDGTHIAFISDRDGDVEVYVMKADGSDVRRITHSPGDDLHPRWLVVEK